MRLGVRSGQVGGGENRFARAASFGDGVNIWLWAMSVRGFGGRKGGWKEGLERGRRWQFSKEKSIKFCRWDGSGYSLRGETKT